MVDALQRKVGDDRTCKICGVDDEKLTREAQLEF